MGGVFDLMSISIYNTKLMHQRLREILRVEASLGTLSVLGGLVLLSICIADTVQRNTSNSRTYVAGFRWFHYTGNIDTPRELGYHNKYRGSVKTLTWRIAIMIVVHRARKLITALVRDHDHCQMLLVQVL